MKRPSFQFYPADWLRDTALRTCSTGARGLWIDMICFMHQGTPYGHLKVGDKVIHAENLARMVGETFDQVKGWLDELEEAKVFDLTDDGVICSRRMIRDEEVRNARAEGGKKGGNPALIGSKGALKVNHEDKAEDKQNPTPSSSSSSSKDMARTASSPVPDCPHQEILSLWAEHLPSAIQPREWTPARSAALKARWREKSQRQSLEFWSRFFSYIGKSDFLMGRVSTPDRRPFELSIDWLLKQENFVKVTEGKYHSKEQT